MYIVFQRVAMEPQVVSPVGDLLLLDIEASWQPSRFRGVIWVILQSLWFRQLEEIPSKTHHVLYHRLGYPMVLHLQNYSLKLATGKKMAISNINMQGIEHWKWIEVPGRSHQFYMPSQSLPQPWVDRGRWSLRSRSGGWTDQMDRRGGELDGRIRVGCSEQEHSLFYWVGLWEWALTRPLYYKKKQDEDIGWVWAAEFEFWEGEMERKVI